jgi:hypothetical protein
MSTPSAKERIGLWLAKWVLVLTGNGRFARCVAILPLVPQRRFVLGSREGDPLESALLAEGHWLLWRQAPEK